MYAVKNGGAVWQILFTTPSNEFQERLPIFEDIVETATIPFTPEDGSGQVNPTSFVIGVVLLIMALFLNYWQRWKKRSKEKSVP